MNGKNLILHLKLLAVLLGAGCVSFVGAGSPFRDGTYQGTGEGYRGPVQVALRIESGGIADIEIAEHGDDPLVGGAAMEELREAVLDANSTALDTVSGATESSAGFLAAVEDALGKAQVREKAE